MKNEFIVILFAAVYFKYFLVFFKKYLVNIWYIRQLLLLIYEFQIYLFFKKHGWQPIHIFSYSKHIKQARAPPF